MGKDKLLGGVRGGFFPSQTIRRLMDIFAKRNGNNE